MWMKVVLCFLVAFAYADQNQGWKHDYEYIYEVRGRLLTSLNQVSDKYSGIILKAKLSIRPRPDGHLGARISEPQYSNVHTQLRDGWEQEIPDSELSYQELPMSPKPFIVKMEQGVVSDIIVEKDISNWESNIIKGIVSQLQLDTQAENQIDSEINLIPQDSNYAVFKTMEKTVTGEHETLYDIHPLPEFVLPTTPWMAPYKELKRKGEHLEVVKTKNFTNSLETPTYYFGFQGINDFDINNKIGEFFARTSVSRAVISGKLNDFVIQSSVTVDQVTINPTLQDKQRGATQSKVNITLHSFQPQSQQFEEVSSPVQVSLVYRYNQPFDDLNNPRFRMLADSSSGESDERSADMRRLASALSRDESYPGVQDKPHIKEAPASPLLPFLVGYNGQAISKKQNIEENVRSLAKEIGREFQQPRNIPQQNTVGKFLTLTGLVKVMNYKEMQHVSEKLYQGQSEEKDPAWVAYRDAVAQAGTGPALLIIKDWISSGQISGYEAARVVATAADSARQPTENYMKVFFQMLKNDQIMQQEYLNQSVILSFTSLVRDVYVNDERSHNRFPVHSFGPFNTEEGRRFNEREVIPYLSQKLAAAISKTDRELIHVYIRALGNVGHPNILSAFKPYLEGTKKASQFQRVLMVLALDNLVYNHPAVARSVLFRIYSNSKDFTQVRVAAVYQLMRANPPAEMLQRMAKFTNVDTDNQVNSAVKSAIEGLAEIKVPHYEELRQAGESARPFLTSKDFGVQNPKSLLKTYISDEMKLQVRQILETFGGEDCILPQGVNYFLGARYGGIRQPILSNQIMLSSVDDLLDVVQQQTKAHADTLRAKQAYESVKIKWSSEYTAKLMNMQNEQREQLEAYVLLHADAFQKIWTFDNLTIEQLTEVVKDLEEGLGRGKHFSYQKMSVYPQLAMSFPTGWGLPFIYTYDRPSLVHIDSDVKATAQPRLYSKDGIQTPETVDIEYEIKGFVSERTQSQMGFFTPYNNQRYSSGYDKNFQWWLPSLSGKIHVDVENKQTTLEIQDIAKMNDANLLHYSSHPYTSQYDIYSTKPSKEISRKQNPCEVNTVLGQEATGFALAVQVKSDGCINYRALYEQMIRKDFMSVLLGEWLNDIQYVEMNIKVDSAKTTTRKMILHAGYKQKYTSGSSSSSPVEENFASVHAVSKDSWDRQKEFLNKCGRDISNVHTKAADVVVLLEGDKPRKYSATFARSQSNVDPKGRVLFQMEKSCEGQKSTKVSVSAVSKAPNTPSLNLDNALEFNPTTTVDIEATIEKNQQVSQKLNAAVELSQSEQRKQYLKEHPKYQECKKQMQEGNYQLPACAFLTDQANLLDKFLVNIKYELEPSHLNKTYHLYSIIRYWLYPAVSENILERHQEKNRMRIEGRYSPDLSSVNASIATEYGTAQIENVYVNDFVRNLLVPHPVYDTATRIQGHIYNYETFEPNCVIDGQAVNTLDNKTYYANLDKDWVVLLHYVPRRPSPAGHPTDLPVYQQLNLQTEGYIVYGRAHGNSKSSKEIKLVIQSKNTMNNVIDVTLKPSANGNGYPRLFIKNEEIMYDDQGSHIYDDYMKVYKLPNGELKVDVYNKFSVAYDGVRAKLNVLGHKFRGATRGLCGTFTGEKETDFTHPGNCIIHSPEVFIAANTVSEKERTKRMNNMMMIQANEKQCYQKSVGYVNVISERDTEVVKSGRQSENMITKTQYVDRGDGEICFSMEPLPACKVGYRELRTTKLVPAHCVKANKLSSTLKNQIDKGANPSFRNKGSNKQVRMSVAQRCEPQN